MTAAMALFLPPWGLLWTYLVGRCGVEEGLVRTAAYAVSGFVCWGLFLLVGGPPTNRDLGAVGGLWTGVAGSGTALLKAKARPWPVAERLALGLLLAAILGLGCGLFQRYLGWRRGWYSVGFRTPPKRPPW